MPDQEETALLALKISGRLPVPSAAAPTSSPTLEATCARVLDLYDPNRIPVLFHAVDPVFLASSRGECLRMLSIVTGCQDFLAYGLC